jgi:tetratricopeptide (TPR) repeat protein
MSLDWTIREPEELPAGETGLAVEVSPPRFDAGGRPWVLFLGSDPTAIEREAARYLQARAQAEGPSEVLSPPEGIALPLAVCRLAPPENRRRHRWVLVQRLERSFCDPGGKGGAVFTLANPLYLLPKLARAAGGGEPVGFVATAVEAELRSRGAEVLAGRGLASRFEVRRLGPSGAEPPPPPGGDRRAAIEESGSAIALLEIALGTANPEQRETACRRALLLEADQALARLCLASALTDQGRLREAVGELQEAIQLDPSLDVAHYELAKLLIRTDNLDGAVEGFRRTSELLPEFSSAWTNLGAALGEKQDLRGAVAALNRAVELDPLSHALHSNLGVTFRNMGRHEEAEAELKIALELAPDFLFGHYNLAYNYFFQGRYEEAVAGFEKARRMDPEKNPRQGMLLALSRLASGDIDGAHQLYREILGALGGQQRSDLITVARWDLDELGRRRPGDAAVGATLALLRELG